MVFSNSTGTYNHRALHLFQTLADHSAVALSRVIAEEALRKRERLSRTIISTAMDGFLRINLQGRIQDANETFCQMTGYTRAEALNMHIYDFSVEDSKAEEIKKRIEHTIEAEKDLFETQFRCADQRIIDVEVSVSYITTAAKSFLCFVRDITAQKQAFASLAQLPRRIIAAQEAERHRVASDLHDSVHQLLCAARFRLRMAEESLTVVNPEITEAFNSCSDILSKVLTEIRCIAYNLRPLDLEDLGFVFTSDMFCKDFSVRTGLVVDTNFASLNPNLSFSDPIELPLFRIIQEALNNVDKHAKATRVQLQLVVQDRLITLTIQDDGCGFNPSAPKAMPGTYSGLGLTSMRERAASIGGALEIISSPGKGTQIVVSIPIPQNEN